MIKGRLIVVAGIALAAGLAALSLVKPLDFGSNRWERVDPTVLTKLPALEGIAPYITIGDAVVFGFQDHVYRFRFQVIDTQTFERTINAAGFSEVKDVQSVVAAFTENLKDVSGLPSWWSGLSGGNREQAKAYSGTTQPAREVTLISVDDLWFGQVVEF